MFMLYALVIGFALGLLLGGRPTGLAQIRFRWTSIAVAGLVVQLALFSPGLTAVVGDAGPPLYVGSTLAVVLVVARNIAVAPGLAIVALGALSNLVAIVANGGFMPVTPEALAASGRAAASGYSNSLETSLPAFDLLVDRFALPPGLPLANVFSVGDVLVGIGMVLVIVGAMRGQSVPSVPTWESSNGAGDGAVPSKVAGGRATAEPGRRSNLSPAGNDRP
jgi:hypothetical protein